MVVYPWFIVINYKTRSNVFLLVKRSATMTKHKERLICFAWGEYHSESLSLVVVVQRIEDHNDGGYNRRRLSSITVLLVPSFKCG